MLNSLMMRHRTLAATNKTLVETLEAMVDEVSFLLLSSTLSYTCTPLGPEQGICVIMINRHILIMLNRIEQICSYTQKQNILGDMKTFVLFQIPIKSISSQFCLLFASFSQIKMTDATYLKFSKTVCC